MFAYLGAVQTGHNHVKFHRYQCRDGVWDFKTKILCNFRISARRCASLALLQEMFIVCGQFHCGKLESKRFAQGVPGLRVFKVGVRFLRVFSDPAQNYCNLCLPHSKRSGWLCATLCLYSTTVRLIYKTYSCIVWSIEFRLEWVIVIRFKCRLKHFSLLIDIFIKFALIRVNTLNNFPRICCNAWWKIIITKTTRFVSERYRAYCKIRKLLLFNENSQQFASSEVSLQLVNPSHSCSALIQEFPREQWNWVELQRSMQTTWYVDFPAFLATFCCMCICQLNTEITLFENILSHLEIWSIINLLRNFTRFLKYPLIS